MHHYFHTHAHFIKTNWVRNVPLRVFVYFLKVAEEKYGEIPRGKVSSWIVSAPFNHVTVPQAEDDGSVFMTFLKESRMSQHSKTVTWEVIRLLMDKYHVAMRAVHLVRDLTYVFLFSLFRSATGYGLTIVMLGGS